MKKTFIILAAVVAVVIGLWIGNSQAQLGEPSTLASQTTAGGAITTNNTSIAIERVNNVAIDLSYTSTATAGLTNDVSLKFDVSSDGSTWLTSYYTVNASSPTNASKQVISNIVVGAIGYLRLGKVDCSGSVGTSNIVITIKAHTKKTSGGGL